MFKVLSLKLYELLLFITPFISIKAFTQPTFTKIDSVKVIENGVTLKNAWAGGINFSQFSAIDLDLDGKKDLFALEKSGNKICTFLNTGTNNNSSYSYAPQFQSKFPALHDWALLVDYNCDGKEDIFSYSIGGFAVYKNISNISGGLQFVKITNQVKSKQFNNLLNLYVSSVDLPAIVDVDNDGDMDVLTFQIAGSYIEYHKNLSMETYGICDSLMFELRNNCWGFFSENSFNNSVVLNDTCSFNVANPEKNYVPVLDSLQQVLHAGSTLLSLDLDGDQDKELILGDISFKNMVMLTNGGSTGASHMVAQDPNFPSNTTGVNIATFPAGFIVDIDNDSKNDLLVTPNAPGISENFTSVWLYKNVGTNSSPVYSYIQNNFLQEQMIDVGEGAYPVFFDYNADGKKDLLIGNYGYFQASGGFKSTLTLYENIGTVTNPKFQLITRDYASLGTYGFLHTRACFGDIDADGDEDMLIGESTGQLNLFLNSAGPGNVASFNLSQANYEGIDVGSNSAPQWVDMNADGLLDLVIGELSGNFNYYENIGTASVASYSLITATFGNVKVNKPSNSIVGSSAPSIFKFNTKTYLLSGSESGYVYLFDSIDNNLNGTFHLLDSMYLNSWDGIKSSPAIADITNDNYPDLMVGTYTGGLAYYQGDGNLGFQNYNTKKIEFNVYPNPAGNTITIEGSTKTPFTISVYNYLGQLQLMKKSSLPQTIDTSEFENGLYFIVIINNHDSKAQHFILEGH